MSELGMRYEQQEITIGIEIGANALKGSDHMSAIVCVPSDLTVDIICIRTNESYRLQTFDIQCEQRLILKISELSSTFGIQRKYHPLVLQQYNRFEGNLQSQLTMP